MRNRSFTKSSYNGKIIGRFGPDYSEIRNPQSAIRNPQSAIRN